MDVGGGRRQLDILIRGTASDVLGIDSDTVLRNTVKDNSTVTSKSKSVLFCLTVHFFFSYPAIPRKIVFLFYIELPVRR